MWPRSGLSSPTSDFRNTDLPVPDGPRRTEISPAGTVSETSCQMVWRPKDLVRPSTLISTPTRHLSSRPGDSRTNERGGLRLSAVAARRRHTMRPPTCYRSVAVMGSTTVATLRRNGRASVPEQRQTPTLYENRYLQHR